MENVHAAMARGEAEWEELSQRLRDAEATLEAIRTGAVDAVVVAGTHGMQVFTLQGADHPYRVMVEGMNEGAVTVDQRGIILYCNARFAELARSHQQDLLGSQLVRLISPADQSRLTRIIDDGVKTNAKEELLLQNGDGPPVPVLLSLSFLSLDSGPIICMVATDLRDQKARHAAEVSESRTKDLMRKLESSQLMLHEKVVDLEGAHEVMVGRELKMIELEKQLTHLKQELAKLKKKV